ncbi:Secreted protein [Streptomyces clavuligerus]|uniref:Secreted protein n=1 Tax=Streptomyces clavuligerus TaxID=1901 RepID=E2Q4F4_STRCL|nr:Secreted protein [Streptomyces clavuligerus]
MFPHRAPGRPGAARRGALGPRLLARLLVILLAMTGLTVLGPVVPSADASPSACPGRPKKVLRLAAGELRVHGGPQHACAVTVAARPGPRRFMLVSLQPRGGRAAVDQGYFTRSAGPVRVYAKNRCVRAVGKISGSTVSTGWILC